MSLDAFKEMIDEAASTFKLDPDVLRAVILTESLADPWSYKYEPNYSYLVNPRDFADRLIISFDSEVALQRTSLGLMHVMGGVCREYGFMGKLSEIFQPQMSLHFGCLHLQRKMQRYGNEPSDIYAAYNAGAMRKTPGGMYVNQTNVDRFHQHLVKLKALK